MLRKLLAEKPIDKESGHSNRTGRDHRENGVQNLFPGQCPSGAGAKNESQVVFDFNQNFVVAHIIIDPVVPVMAFSA